MKRKSVKRRPFFDASEIAIAISLHLTRDLASSTHEYDEQGSTFYREVQQNALLKKFVPPSVSQSSLESATFEKFLKINRHMSGYTQEVKTSWEKPYITSEVCDRDKILLRARALMHFVLTDFSMEEWFRMCKNSGGASVGVSYKDTSLEAKSTYPLSVTSRAKPLMESYFRYDVVLAEAVAQYNEYSVLPKYETVMGSQATTVEKNSKIRRMISKEPTCNMFLQQGLMQLMYQRMERVGLNVESLPDLHQKLAFESSITSRNATIDWSSASDCVSIELLRYLLPPKWFDIIDRIRSPYTNIQDQLVELNMISTMGNAVTFPLETLVFWTMAHAVRLTQDKHTNTLFPEWEDRLVCSVFGDDCIVPSSMASQFIETLEEYGFIVNQEKSCIGRTKFRESCGGDYLAGRTMRPFYLRAPVNERKSSLEPWLYTILNGLIPKYISYFGPLGYVYDKHVFRYIFSLFKEHKIKIRLVPLYFPDDAGLKISPDLSRFSSCYDFKLSKLYKSRHGTYKFQFCRFNYNSGYMSNEELRYAVALKTPSFNSSPTFSPPFRKLRRKGGYVVGKGISCHWHVPVVRPDLY